MSVLVKGMGMPKTCGECLLSWVDDYYANNPPLKCNLVDCGKLPHFGLDPDAKHPDCPLVEIPIPHGRLIDADKLAKEILRAWNLWEKKGEDCYLFADVITPMLVSCPTVIESEK